MTVVVGVDESPLTTHVVAAAIDQARYRDSVLHVVHVTYAPMVYSEVPLNWSEVLDAQRTHAWAQIEPFIAQGGVDIERVDLEGYPPDVLVEYTSEVNAELLVVGTRGRGEFASLIMGSTSHRAIHLATCDVLVVKRTKEH